MSEKIISVKEYFEKGTFAIPNYQRGYKWSVPDEKGKCGVGELMDDLLNAYLNCHNEYFIEAVTVAIENDLIVLVDGQQRTTTLFLILIALGDFDFLKTVKLDYKVRKDSDLYLKELITNQGAAKINDDIQDIYYFNKALKTIKKHFPLEKDENIMTCTRPIKDEIGNIVDKKFVDFLKENVLLLYNKIPADNAISNFMALNSLKAKMKDEELIKSDMLINASRITIDTYNITDCVSCKSSLGIEWKISEDRGILARNWDKWLYWWNQEQVKEYYGTDNKHPLYFLLVTYWNINKSPGEEKSDFDFDNFRNKFIDGPVGAKNHFEGLRKLQKTFEDFYDIPKIYNFLGLILKVCSGKSKEDALQYFLKKQSSDFEGYAKWAIVKATHMEIVSHVKENENDSKEISIRERKAQKALDLINSKYVYWDENDNDYKDDRKEFAYRFLTLLNLNEDNKLDRKFDFSVWAKRSLEHIFPKIHKGNLDFDNPEFQEGSIHCIGNLVLLYVNNNSTFKDKSPQKKKELYFETGQEFDFKSRNLLHTLSVFAANQWTEKEIIENKIKTIKTLTDYYGLK